MDKLRKSLVNATCEEREKPSLKNCSSGTKNKTKCVWTTGCHVVFLILHYAKAGFSIISNPLSSAGGGTKSHLPRCCDADRHERVRARAFVQLRLRASLKTRIIRRPRSNLHSANRHTSPPYVRWRMEGIILMVYFATGIPGPIMTAAEWKVFRCSNDLTHQRASWSFLGLCSWHQEKFYLRHLKFQIPLKFSRFVEKRHSRAVNKCSQIYHTNKWLYTYASFTD